LLEVTWVETSLDDRVGLVPIYAAFQRFICQYRWLREEMEDQGIEPMDMARCFALRNLKSDFWDDTEMWPVINPYGAAMSHLLAIVGGFA
jgi:hypothetical protein